MDPQKMALGLTLVLISHFENLCYKTPRGQQKIFSTSKDKIFNH